MKQQKIHYFCVKPLQKHKMKYFKKAPFVLIFGLIISLCAGCKKSDETIITISVTDIFDQPESNCKVYEFDYPSTHQYGNNPFVANRFRLTDKSGDAVFIINNNDYDKTVPHTLYYTVFNETSGNTYTVAGSVKVDLISGENFKAKIKFR